MGEKERERSEEDEEGVETRMCVCGSGEACAVVMSDIKHSCHITGTINELRAVTPTAATIDLWSYWLNSSDTAPLPGLDQSGVQIRLPSAQSFSQITLVGLCPLKPFFKNNIHTARLQLKSGFNH